MGNQQYDVTGTLAFKVKWIKWLAHMEMTPSDSLHSYLEGDALSRTNILQTRKYCYKFDLITCQSV